MHAIIRLNALFLAFVSVNAIAAPKNPIGNFAQVSPGIYRGALPGIEGLRYLKSKGIKTILTLDGNRSAVEEEIAYGAAIGLPVVSVPMSFFWRPRTRTVNAALAVLNDLSLRPIFVHCHAGQDRTGLIVGLQRVERQGWDPHKAYDEMTKYGFHPELFLLKDYFEWRTDTDL